MQYHFTSLGSLADYLCNRATMFRESAANAKSKSKSALMIERASTHESIADMIRHTTLHAEKDVIILNPQREKKDGM